MARAYKIYLEPENIGTRTAYLIEPDECDGEPELTTNDADAFDLILCDNEGYYVASVEPVSLEQAKRHRYYG